MLDICGGTIGKFQLDSIGVGGIIWLLSRGVYKPEYMGDGFYCNYYYC
jgi:hypothetical protein